MNSLFQQALSVFLCDFVDVLNFVPLPAISSLGWWDLAQTGAIVCVLSSLFPAPERKVFQDEETGEDAVLEMWMISELHTDVTVLSILFLSLFNCTEHWGHSPMTVHLLRRSCYLGIVLRTCLFVVWSLDCFSLVLFFYAKFHLLFYWLCSTVCLQFSANISLVAQITWYSPSSPHRVGWNPWSLVQTFWKLVLSFKHCKNWSHTPVYCLLCFNHSFSGDGLTHSPVAS